ncbi:hypothetical protein KQ944_12495 [Bacillus subtilis]|uniref:hypothetical protein n=1 Tax=Pseudochrobactrum asaccharolyticum TaxID=354351 RepID=UPI001F1AE222|nr:hypothetical protein [Pseudochrobactrum asaccharolyticum]MCF7645985.1 hypothetical protein [Pseudochrobactrum asaccharolyticum]MCF7672452.1 hypothetical protein [Bacillus subtilis]
MKNKVTWLTLLDKLVSSMTNSSKRLEYPFNRILELVDAPSSTVLNLALSKLVLEHKLEVFYRIRSPLTGAGIKEFRSILDIPETIYDDTADNYFAVNIEKDVETIYRAPA